jgi:hypothetical protein
VQLDHDVDHDGGDPEHQRVATGRGGPDEEPRAHQLAQLQRRGTGDHEPGQQDRGAQHREHREVEHDPQHETGVRACGTGRPEPEQEVEDVEADEQEHGRDEQDHRPGRVVLLLRPLAHQDTVTARRPADHRRGGGRDTDFRRGRCPPSTLVRTGTRPVSWRS